MKKEELLHSTLMNLVQNYGYWIVFIAVACEGIGIPLPGETSLIVGAALAASGHLSLVPVIVIAASAAIVGDNAGYWIGRKGGRKVLLKYGWLLPIGNAKLEKVHGYFERHGTKTVFVARFVAIFRTCAAMFAGVAYMPYRSFVLFNALGGITWAVVYGAVGYAFGHNLPRLEHHLRIAAVALVCCGLLALLFVRAARWFKRPKNVLRDGG
ncbi:MAG: DedA family protein [Edaphobacter sp.]